MTDNPLLVISCSLNPESRSRRLADVAVKTAEAVDVPVEFVSLRDHELPFCDGATSSAAPAVQLLRDKVARASAVLLAAPVYNYGLNAAAKNLIELTGPAWENKVVGFMCAAGGM